jgi:hypothetical protein
VSVISSFVTSLQERVLEELFDLLEGASVIYQATGGLAGLFHGSRWPLHDIDLDVQQADLGRLAIAFGPALVEAPRRIVGREFNFVQLQASLHGMSIDISQAEDARIKVGERWQPLVTDLGRRERHEWRGRTVWVQPLADVLAYKRLLGRTNDIADLESLSHAGAVLID